MYKCFVPKDVFANFSALKIFGSNFRDQTDPKPPNAIQTQRLTKVFGSGKGVTG